jgi:SAM-dependent methyltransferase
MSKRCSDVLFQISKAIDRELERARSDSSRPLNVLDVGCWDGENTERYRRILGGWSRGVEVFKDQAEKARNRGIDVAEVDLETGRFPWDDASVDVVVANQVFEHLKNVWLPMSEIGRVLAPGGMLVFSVPNLGSLHNRLMLGAGLQPSSIRTFGPHVRGFTYRQAKHFVEFDGYFRVMRAVGVGFYPLPAGAADWLANLWVSASHTPVIVAKRMAVAGTMPPWAAMLAAGEQTFYASAS